MQHDQQRLTAAIQMATGQLEAANLLPDHQRWTEILHVLTAARDEITRLQQSIPIDHDCMAGHPAIDPMPSYRTEIVGTFTEPPRRRPGRPRKVTPEAA